MIYDKEKIFEIGKSFETGLVGYEALSASEKFALSRYYAIKNEELDGAIIKTENTLNSINAHLDNVKNNLLIT